MAEYIEREKLPQEVSADGMSDNAVIFASGYNTCLEDVKSIPAADVRPVVTCGECKHWFENGTDYCSCDRDALLRERNFFCAAGEKREES